MTKKPEKYADRPGLFAHAGEPDALSDILHTVRLRGDSLIRCAPAPPFRIEVPVGLRILHIAETGGIRVHVDDAAIPLDPGDMVLLARGDAHSIRAGTGAPARPLEAADRHSDRSDAHPRWVSGSFAVENDVAGPLLAVLPEAIVVRAGAPDREWLLLSLQLLLVEVVDPRPGAWVMISRILDLLFIHALREWSGTADATPGWLTASVDAQLSPVLTAIHKSPEYPWTVSELAGIAKQSRSTFAERFTRLLGQSPAAYIADRRLDRAAHLLRSTSASVSSIARDVGYASDSAFTRAFQRRYDESPLRWRRSTTQPSSRLVTPKRPE